MDNRFLNIELNDDGVVETIADGGFYELVELVATSMYSDKFIAELIMSSAKVYNEMITAKSN